ncbi:MAG: sodium:calcium antiporter [Flavitalea sp.]
MVSFLGFVFCAGIILFAGRKLSIYGLIISDLTGLGKAWIGLILMASVTSLPELMVGISSSAIVQSADLAVGDILGSCAFNLGILAFMDVFVPQRKSLFGTASQSHVLAAAMGIILITMAGVGLYLPSEFSIITGIGLTSIFFIVIYIVSVRLLYKFEIKRKSAQIWIEKEKSGKDITLKKAITMYSLFAVVTIIAALFLPHFAEQIAEKTGLGKTFVATLFLAASTSLPELAVSFSAIRMGSIDISVGNLLGSNIFNVFILAMDDVWYTKGPLLNDASDAKLVSVLFIILMSAIAIIGLSYRAENKRYWMAWDAILIFVLYFFNLILLFRLTS